MVTGKFKVFQLDDYALLDPGSTLPFVMPYVDLRFDVLTDVRLEPFYVAILLMILL